MNRWCRYLPYAIIVWFAKHKLEQFKTEAGITMTIPFSGEIVAFRTEEKV